MSTTESSMYLCVRRLNQVFFVKCHPDDTVGYVKEQLSLATQKEIQPGHMRLLKANQERTPLEDDAEQLSKHKDLVNTTTAANSSNANTNTQGELLVVYQIADGEWENVYVESMEEVAVMPPPSAAATTGDEADTAAGTAATAAAP